MSIRNRLTLLFTAIVAVIFTTILSAIYVISVRYSEASFYERLKERAFIAQKIFLEKNQLNRQLLVEFEQKDLGKLSHEVLQIYHETNQVTSISPDEDWQLLDSELQQIRNLKKYDFQKEDRYITSIYNDEGQQKFIVVASAIDIVGNNKIKRLRLVMIASFFVGLIIIYLSGRFFANNALSPINEVMQQVRQFSDTNLSMRVVTSNEKDEIGILTQTFNEMLERIEGAFESQRSFVSLASHEFRTPLTAIIGELQILTSKERSINDYKIGIEKALQESRLLKNIIDDLLIFTRTNIDDRDKDKENIRIDELIWEVHDEVILRNNHAKFKIDFQQMPDNQDYLIIQGNKHLLELALVNVIENAIKYSNCQEVKCLLEYSNHYVKICISDKGIGIPAADLKHITEPFFRASNVSEYYGTGIGLALTQKIVEKHKGALQIFSTEGKGTMVNIVLPTLFVIQKEVLET